MTTFICKFTKVLALIVITMTALMAFSTGAQAYRPVHNPTPSQWTEVKCVNQKCSVVKVRYCWNANRSYMDYSTRTVVKSPTYCTKWVKFRGHKVRHFR